MRNAHIFGLIIVLANSGTHFKNLLIINRVQFELSFTFKHLLNSVIKQAIGIIAIIARFIIYEARLLY